MPDSAPQVSTTPVRTIREDGLRNTWLDMVDCSVNLAIFLFSVDPSCQREFHHRVRKEVQHFSRLCSSLRSRSCSFYSLDYSEASLKMDLLYTRICQ
jgi:hypothetical protein